MTQRHTEIRIAPSILNADLAHLADQVQLVQSAGADWIHLDVMDGQFVPNLTFGPNIVAAVRRITTLPLDVHLMVEHPETYLDAMTDAGASVFTFHPEATRHPHRVMEEAKRRGMLGGLALNPGTPLSAAEELIDELDLLLIMSVSPGFGGQQYIPSSTDKIARARHLIREREGHAYLEVDGGITTKTIGSAQSAGADTFVIGSAIFAHDDPAAALRDLRARAQPVARA